MSNGLPMISGRPILDFGFDPVFEGHHRTARSRLKEKLIDRGFPPSYVSRFSKAMFPDSFIRKNFIREFDGQTLMPGEQVSSNTETIPLPGP